MKPPDFVEPTNGIEGIEKTRVAGCKFARLEIPASQICIAKRSGRLPREKVKTQPAAVRRRHPLGFSKKSNKQQKNKISVHLSLKLQIPRKIFGRNFAHSAFELERCVQRMVQFF